MDRLTLLLCFTIQYLTTQGLAIQDFIKANTKVKSAKLIALYLIRRRRTQRRFWLSYLKKVENRGLRHAVVNRTLRIVSLYFNRDTIRFPEHFRLQITTFQSLVTFLFVEEKCHGWSLEIELLTFMFWLASGCSYRVVSAVFEMPRSTICRIVHKYLRIFTKKIKHFVNFPSREALPAVGRGFCRMAKNNCFEKAAGAIDGCHVRIGKVPENQAPSYINRKGFFSSNFQGTVDHEGLFIDAFIGFPGSVHDSRILRNSPMFYKKLYPPKGYYLLGDGGYPLLTEPIGILTPYRMPTATPVEGRFNTIHAKARSIVERTFGRLKARWRSIFFKALECNYMRVPFVIAACIALHNFCMNCDDIIEPEVRDSDDEDEDPLGQNGDNDVSGGPMRTAIAARASRNVQPLPGHLSNDHSYSS